MSLSVAGAEANLRTESLFQLASIDLIELCREAKVEHCRATRDLSSCGRNVQHVLNSCRHASLCTECSQRCDVCPICRTPLPKSGIKLNLRLFNKCIEAGLISRKCDERSEDKTRNREHLDIQRLYSLFDVALENNLVSLICHYVTDVCLDEGAVSSDPVLAFLLDEVVVKDWCKWKYRSIVTDLHGIYVLGIEGMVTKIDLLLKFSSQLNGIANVLEVLESSFAATLSAELHDLHMLSENTLKTKQHLEVMMWCIRHKCLENVESRYSDSISWSLHVSERKSAAIKRTWPSLTSKPAESAVQSEATLFIEDALLNLHIEQDLGEEVSDEFDATFLRADSYHLPDPSLRVEVSGLYPFKNLRSAADILFLHGRSDMVVAKQAIFLYYLFDRHWTMPDVGWRHIVDDFSASFGITRHSLLESLVFYLLDDHSEEALHQASNLLPEIAGPETHPKVAKVVLERQSPDLALTVLRCSGHDGFSANAIVKRENVLVSLSEAVTAVRVRVECGLLTEAFMYQRMHCSLVKEDRLKHRPFAALSDDIKDGFDSWMHHSEVLVTEICSLCMRRNLVDRMIELPWSSDEEVFLHKCLFDNASQQPSSINGSLLVVFYLQRCRYIEACQIDRKLRGLERSSFQAASEEEFSKIRTISQWRTGLVNKCIDLLPDAQRLQLKSGDLIHDDPSHSKGTIMASDAAFIDEELPNSISSLASSSMKPSVQAESAFFLKKASGFMNTRLTHSVGIIGFEQRDMILHQKNMTSHRSMMAVQGDYKNHSANVQNGEHSSSDGFFNRETMQKDVIRHQFPNNDFSIQREVGSYGTPLVLKMNKLMVPQSDTRFQDEKNLFGVDLPDSTDHLEETHFSFLQREFVQGRSGQIGTVYRNGISWSSYHNHISTSSARDSPAHQSWPSVPLEEANMDFSWRSDKKENPEDLNMISGPRWRSDESSDDEARQEAFLGGNISSVKRRSRYGRR